MEPLSVGVVASPREWRTALQSHVRDHVADVVLKVLREPRAAFDQHLDALVVDDVASFVTRHNLERLRDRGVRIVGVYDPNGDEGQGRRFLEDLGVDITVSAESPPEHLLATVVALGPGLDAMQAELEALLDDAASLETDPDGVDVPPAAVVAVGGPAGAGATEVAIALAGAVGSRGQPCVLVDLDAGTPSVARRLLYALEPNVLSALDALRRTQPVADCLATRARGAPGTVRFHVVAGLANTADWPELRPGDVVAFISHLTELGATVIADVGGSLDDVGDVGRERFGAARALVDTADVNIAVGRADPVGVLALLDWAAVAHDLRPDRRTHVVLNRAPRSPYRRAQLARQVTANASAGAIVAVAFAPDDPRVADAVWDGAPVGPGPLARAARDLAAAWVPAPSRDGAGASVGGGR